MRILLVEDLTADAEIALRELTRAGLEFEHRLVDTREGLLRELRDFAPHIVISDYSMPGFDGMQALELAHREDPLLPFIVLTGSMNEATAVACMKAGATDYVIKSRITRLPFAVQEALVSSEAQRERARTTEALRESEQNFRTLADSGHALIRTTDEDGLARWFNAVWIDFTGRSPAEERENGWMENIHPEDLERCRSMLQSAFARRESYEIVFRLRHKNGDYRWILETGSARYSADKTFIGFIGHCLDITERKEQEERIRAALREKEKLLQELYHRTRNTIQVIVALMEIRAGATTNRQVGEAMQAAAERILSMSLVHKNLYETRNLSEIDLPALLDDLRAMVIRDHACDRRGIRLEQEVQPMKISIDTAMPLALVTYELLSNAVDHAFCDSPGGTVKMSACMDQEAYITLEMADNGCGVPEDFSPWEQDGVGLQFVHMLVEHQLRGSVRIMNGQGLTCEVRFQETGKESRI